MVYRMDLSPIILRIDGLYPGPDALSRPASRGLELGVICDLKMIICFRLM